MENYIPQFEIGSFCGQVLKLQLLINDRNIGADEIENANCLPFITPCLFWFFYACTLPGLPAKANHPQLRLNSNRLE